MEIYNKINIAIDRIKNSDLKKIGYNDYSKYSYYTPEQVDKLVYDACKELKLFIKFDLPRDQYGIYGTLLIINIETHKETVLYTMASDIPQLTATNISQQLGGAATFAKRYLMMNAFDIVDNNLDFDTTQNTKKQASTNKEPENWLNVRPTKTSKKFTSEFLIAWHLIQSKESTLKDLRKLYKISKDTAKELENKSLVKYITDEQFSLTLDSKLDQILAVLHTFAMNEKDRQELEKIVNDAKIEEKKTNYERIKI